MLLHTIIFLDHSCKFSIAQLKMLVLCWYWRKRKFYFCVAAHGSGLPVEIMVQSFCITKLHVAKIQSIILDVAVMKGKELTVVDSNGEVSSRGGLDSFG